MTTNTKTKGAVLTAIVLLGGCGLFNKAVGGGSGGRCEGLDSTDSGRKIQAYLDATADLQKASADVENITKDACIKMGQDLDLPGGQLSGDTKVICANVVAGIKANLKISIKTGKLIKVKYTPGKCELNMDAQASAVASCSGGASAGAGAVTGAGECAAVGAVHASLEAKCSPPSVDVGYDPLIVIDDSKVQKVKKAFEDGLPALLSATAKAEALNQAVAVWSATATNLAKSAKDVVKDMAARTALCTSNALSAAADARPAISLHIEVSVQASAQVGGSASGEGEGAAGAGTN